MEQLLLQQGPQSPLSNSNTSQLSSTEHDKLFMGNDYFRKTQKVVVNKLLAQSGMAGDNKHASLVSYNVSMPIKKVQATSLQGILRHHVNKLSNVKEQGAPEEQELR